MELLWKQIYPSIRNAVKTAESSDGFFQAALDAIATAYQAEGLLWTGLDDSNASAPCVYATANAWQVFDEAILDDADLDDADLDNADVDPADRVLEDQPALSRMSLQIGLLQHPPIRMVRLYRSPDWLLNCPSTPQVSRGDRGEVVASIPLSAQVASDASRSSYPAFVLQMKRSPDGSGGALTATSAPIDPFAQPADLPDGAPEPDWSAAELDAIQVLCGQLELAYSALIWKQQFKHAHQQTALVGRIAHLINSSLNPDEIVRQILAELGQNLRCDRCIVLDLRHEPSKVLARWAPPDALLKPMPQTTHSTIWGDLIDMFLQGGTSYREITPHAEDDDPCSSWLSQSGAGSALVFPLFVLEEFLGAIVLLFAAPGRAYGVQELQVVRQVSDQLAIALTNAQHYQNPWYKQEALRLQNNSLQMEIIRDECTHLLNRHSFENELNQLSSQAVWAIQPPFSILMCDLDYFKLVNDTHGHLIGDEVLQTLAYQLQQQLRRGTSLYRYGGEEFVAILSETGLIGAKEVAERLRRTIRAHPITTTAGPIDLTLSFGVAEQMPERDRHARDVLSRAEKALYQAKCKGRDRVEVL